MCVRVYGGCFLYLWHKVDGPSDGYTGHVIEEERETVSGVEFLTSSRENWKGSFLNGHITWHLALYYLGTKLSGTCCATKYSSHVLWQEVFRR